MSVFSGMESISDNQTFYKHYSTPQKASDSLLNISIVLSQGSVGGFLWLMKICLDLTNSIWTKDLEPSVITTPTGDPDRKWYLRRCVHRVYVDELTLISKFPWMWGRKTISSSSHSCRSSVWIRPLILHLWRPSRINTYTEWDVQCVCVCV